MLFVLKKRSSLCSQFAMRKCTYLVVIRKTYLYNFDPIKPYFYNSKTGVYRGIHYLFSAEKQRLWVLVRTGSHNLCFEQKYEKISEFLSENFHFLVVKFSGYLNRHVFVIVTDTVILAFVPIYVIFIFHTVIPDDVIRVLL